MMEIRPTTRVQTAAAKCLAKIRRIMVSGQFSILYHFHRMEVKTLATLTYTTFPLNQWISDCGLHLDEHITY